MRADEGLQAKALGGLDEARHNVEAVGVRQGEVRRAQLPGCVA